MGEGFIVRKGGAVTEQTSAPTITEVSITQTSITFTITNNDASTAVILYEIGDVTPDENSIELATGVTSDSIEVTGLDIGTEYTVSATASVTGKVLSNVTSLAIETDEIIYTAATGGTTLEYDSGGKRYKSHTFTSDGNFIVSTVGDATDDRNKVDYLIIAGGGSGGIDGAGGGGAGGFRTTVTPVPSDQSADAKVVVTATTYGVVVGAGGASYVGTRNSAGQGNQGIDSSALGITASGGGLGGAGNGALGGDGGNGGSGGGSVATGSVGTGTLGQGRDGGDGDTDGATYGVGGGGGGAGAVGANATSGGGGNGGNGLDNNLRTGSNETRGGGGGGGGDTRGTRSAGSGGTGGGGDGSNTSTATPGTANTGGGGGAIGFNAISGSQTTGAGGSGIVVIRYEIAPSV